MGDSLSPRAADANQIEATRISIDRRRVIRIVEGRWFALADFAVLSISLALLTAQEINLTQDLDIFQFQIGGWPLVVALIPWGIRLLAGRFPFRRTELDIPIAIILLTGAIGVWSAYDQDAAWAKFWLIAGGVMIFYSTAGQPRINLWLIGGFLGLLGFFIAVYYLMTPSWTPSYRIELIDEIGARWMSIRPKFQAQAIHRNTAAGFMAMMAPFIGATSIHCWRERRKVLAVIATAAFSVILIALILTTSRGAWVALSSALGIWIMWHLSGYISKQIRWSRSGAFVLGLVFMLGSVVWLVFVYPGGIVGLADSLPGSPNAGTRLELARDSLDLIADFPILGAGLVSFPGLYSQYILMVPEPSIEHGHNLYLETWLETGPLSLLALLVLIVGSAWLLIRKLMQSEVSVANDGIWRWAVIMALTVICVHGLVDYMHEGLPFMLISIGMAIALTKPDPMGVSRQSMRAEQVSAFIRRASKHFLRVVAVVIVVIAAIILVYRFRKSLMASWYANKGALEMASIELQGWPAVIGDVQRDLSEAESQFIKSLQLDSNNRTAHHRLGLIALEEGEIASALEHLERALQIDRDHQGIWRSLGHAYVESGHIAQFIERDDGLLEQEAGDKDEAFAIWKANPSAKSFLTDQAQDFSEKGEFEKALQFYQFALEIDGQDSQLYFELGVAKLKAGQDPESDFFTATQLSGTNVRLYHQIALAYLFNGAFPHRAASWCQALETSLQQHLEAMTCLGKISFYEGRLDQALAYFEVVAQLALDTKGDWMYWLGRTYRYLGRPEDAIQYLELAGVQAEYPSAWIFHELARAYRATHKCDIAITTLRNAILVDPTYPHLDEATRELQEMETGFCVEDTDEEH